MPAVPLTDEQRAVLDFAGRWYQRAGARVQAMHDELRMTPTRYAQILNQLLDDMDAAIEYPRLVRQMRDIRARRVEQKAGRRRAADL